MPGPDQKAELSEGHEITLRDMLGGWNRPPWIVRITTGAILSKNSAAWLSDVAGRVPEEHRTEFFDHLHAVAEELGAREHYELAAAVLAIWEARPR